MFRLTKKETNTNETKENAIEREIIAQGAEAIIIRQGDKIIKKRIPKKYRHEKIDETLRFSRTKREAKVLTRLPVKGPELINAEKDTITMSYIKGKKLADCLEEDITIMKKVGETITKLHDKNIAHGDLTTSNMIKQDNNIWLIDFGLSFFTNRIEDKAVDIHLLKEALESKHYKVWKEAYNTFIKNYKPKDREEILQRLKEVEKRGKYKHKK